MKKKLPILTILLIGVILLRTPFAGDSSTPFHTPEEITFLKSYLQTPLDSGEYFALPENCRGCHGYDSMGVANVDINGMDVNLFDDWETSMMGLAAVDPLWRAKVSHEILVNPAHALELQTLCTRCHAPLGHYTAFYKGQPHYTLGDLLTDSLGQSGVSCHSCHGIKDSSSLGFLFTGQIPYDTNRIIYGPFPGPFTGPMQLYEGLLPSYGPHLGESKACSPCHTLISATVDSSGTPTGGSFVEQATYHEYLNSDYPAVIQKTCQSCHMPSIEDPVKIANGYTSLLGRSPFNLHTFAGANSFMVQLIKDNKASLGVSAPDKNFDSTLKAITTLLREQTLDIVSSFDSSLSDTAYFSIKLINKAGHKFPSGYPSRRAVLQFVAVKPTGDTLFSSGLFDSNYEVQQINTMLEPHHDIINSSSRTQVYEMVMEDVYGNRTTVLERAADQMKDNRIPPLGFTTLHPVYDTCRIVGSALQDPDFNKVSGIEGSGADIVHYHVPLQGYSGNLSVYATVYYQTLPPAFLSEMQQFSSAEIDTFLSMYANADKSPVLITSDTLDNLFIPVGIDKKVLLSQIKVGPNPNHDGRIFVQGLDQSTEIECFNLKGQRLALSIRRSDKITMIQLPPDAGIYYLVFRKEEEKIIKKIIRH